MPSLSELWIYPIKSCAGVSLPRARVEARGIEDDRRYMLVDARGRFVSQRQHPRLARVSVEVARDGLVASADGMPSLSIERPRSDAESLAVSVWGDCLEARAAPEADDWFSKWLGIAVRLVFLPPERVRPISPERGQPGDELSFADGAPLLLVASASLRALNDRLERPVDMARFRGNLIIDTGEPFVEDTWKRVRIGDVELEIAWPCARCVMTTVQPKKGIRDSAGQPLRTLTGFRSSPSGPLFGQNVIPRRLGTVKIGDDVEVLEAERSA